MTHELKTYPKYFQETIEGNKPFEIRKNDRNFQVGDVLILKEWDGPGRFQESLLREAERHRQGQNHQHGYEDGT